MHLESGSEAVIVEGEVKVVQKPSRSLGEKLSSAYREKYAALGYSPKPNQWDNGGLYTITLQTAMAWTNFTDDPTKYVFEEE